LLLSWCLGWKCWILIARLYKLLEFDFTPSTLRAACQQGQCLVINPSTFLSAFPYKQKSQLQLHRRQPTRQPTWHFPQHWTHWVSVFGSPFQHCEKMSY
jgi:hypothetical protein